MKFSLLAFILIIGLFILIDWLIYLILRKSKVYRIINIVHLIIALAGISFISYLFPWHNQITDWHQYNIVQLVALFLTAIYGGKLVYLIWHRFTHHTIQLVKKIHLAPLLL